MYGNTSSAYKTYANNAVTTATPGKLLIMLYEGAIKFMRLAEMAIDNSDFEKRNLNLGKAQSILLELKVTLNHEAGEIAGNLEQLYDFLYYQLVQANVRNDKELIEGAREMMTELKEVWKEIG